MLPSPSDAQRDAIVPWTRGLNTVCSACAGAGKSTLLAHVCRATGAPTMVLAYNKELAADTKRILDAHAPHARCYTFHGLCTRLFRLTHDDDALEDVVDDLEQQRLATRELDDVRHVCVDEAQDLKETHLRLLRALFRDAAFFVVGDEVQMLYDYDPDDPASLRYMREPERHFPSTRAWERRRLGESFRISRRVSDLVNHALAPEYEPLRGVGASEEPVSLFTISPFQAEPIVSAAIRHYGHRNVMLLTATKKNNKPLTLLLNQLSNKYGKALPLHVHGTDTADERGKQGKLRVLTWHASKGTQTRVAIVLGVNAESSHNALHVALTRASRKLIVLQDADRVHPAFDPEGVARLRAAGSVVCDDASLRIRAPRPRSEHADDVSHFAVDAGEWSPRGRARGVDALLRVDAVPALYDMSVHMVRTENTWEDASEAICLAALLRVEHEMRGACRRVERTLSAAQRTREQVVEGIVQARQERYHVARAVDMLPPDLRGLVEACYDTVGAGEATASTWITVACVLLSWGKYHHRTRQLLPSTWFSDDIFNLIFEHARRSVATMGTDAQFDELRSRVVERAKGADADDARPVVLHGRPCVCDAERVLLFVFGDQITGRDRQRATLMATLGPPRDAPRAEAVVNLKDGSWTRVRVLDEAAFLGACMRIL